MAESLTNVSYVLAAWMEIVQSPMPADLTLHFTYSSTPTDFQLVVDKRRTERSHTDITIEDMPLVAFSRQPIVTTEEPMRDRYHRKESYRPNPLPNTNAQIISWFYGDLRVDFSVYFRDVVQAAVFENIYNGALKEIGKFNVHFDETGEDLHYIVVFEDLTEFNIEETQYYAASLSGNCTITGGFLTYMGEYPKLFRIFMNVYEGFYSPRLIEENILLMDKTW